MTSEEVTGVVIASPGGLANRDGRGGGMATVSGTMVDWLKQSRPRIRVTVLDPRGGGAALMWPLHLARSMTGLIALWLSARPQVLHLQVSRRSSFTRKGLLLHLGRMLGMRTVVHHHGSEFIQFYRDAHPLMRAWVRRVVKRADANIVLGEKWRRFLVDELGAEDEFVHIMFNAAQDRGFRRRARTQGEPLRILLMANLSPRKGISELLRAVALLVQAGVEVDATLAGGGAIDRYREEARFLGVDKQCSFPGWVDGERASQLVEQADVLVLPSFQEGFPMAVIEALSAGLPVVTTPVGSQPEALADEVDCLFVPPGDVAALANAIGRLDQDAVLRAELALNGRKTYESRFAIDAYMQKLLQVYEAVIATANDAR